MKFIEGIIAVAAFILVPAICYYATKKTDRRDYNWKDIIWIILFAYLWKCGHALTARCFGIVADKVNVGFVENYSVLEVGSILK